MYFSTEADPNLNLTKNLFSLYETLIDLIHRWVENKLQILTFSCIWKRGSIQMYSIYRVHLYFNSHMNQTTLVKIIFDWEIQMWMKIK